MGSFLRLKLTNFTKWNVEASNIGCFLWPTKRTNSLLIRVSSSFLFTYFLQAQTKATTLVVFHLQQVTARRRAARRGAALNSSINPCPAP